MSICPRCQREWGHDGLCDRCRQTAPTAVAAPRILRPARPAPLRPNTPDVLPRATRRPEGTPEGWQVATTVHEARAPQAATEALPDGQAGDTGPTRSHRPPARSVPPVVKPAHPPAAAATDAAAHAPQMGQPPRPAPSMAGGAPLPGDSTQVEPSVTPSPAPTKAPGARRVRLGRGRVFVAGSIDALLVAGVSAAATFAAGPGADTVPAEKLLGWLALADLVFFALVAIAVAAGILGSLVALSGRTLGGWLCGVRIVCRVTGARPNPVRSVLRGIGAGLGGVVLLTGPAYAFWLDPWRRGGGDLLAQTLTCVAEREMGHVG